MLIAVGRNERAIMPAFFNHYRNLGVRQFAILDNLSTDGSLDYLVEQNDVFCFSSPNQYKYSMFGVAWQKLLWIIL